MYDAPGAAFFQRKRDEKRQQTATAQALATCIEKVHGAAVERARAAVRNPLRPMPRGPAMVFNGAYLVPIGIEPVWRHHLKALDLPQGFELALTGPWAPYNFTGGKIHERYTASVEIAP